MGKLIVTEYVSLDGVMQAPGGGEEFEHAGWSFAVDRGADGVDFKLDETRRSDALLFGRTTYDAMAAAWPHMSGEVADKFNSMPKFVVSSTLADAGWDNSEILRGDLTEEVHRLKRRFKGDVVVHGSAQLVQALVRLDLVDELRLMVFPVSLGSGKRLFGDADEMKRFRLVGSSVVGDGIAVLTYRPVYEYVVSQRIDAAVDAVWRAWTQPDEYGTWFNAVPGSVFLDVRPGGRWKLVLRSAGGEAPELLSGSYLDVVPQEKLVISTTFAGGDTVMDIALAPDGTGTRVEIRQTCASVGERDGGREGSLMLLEWCSTYLAGRAAVER
jgi:dihydrofolate reductase